MTAGRRGRAAAGAAGLLVACCAAAGAPGGPSTAGGTWERVYRPPMTDPATGGEIGGTEVIHLAAHKGRLYAGNGYWMDPRHPERIPWAQVVVQDRPGGPWRVDLAMGKGHLRVTALESVRLETDARGRALRPAVRLLLAASDIMPAGSRASHVFTRDDATGRWARTTLPGDGRLRRCTRAFHVHRDARTGIDRIFVAAGAMGVYSGIYDPAAAGRIRWGKAPELGPLRIRPMAFAEANGVLYVSAGTGIYRRHDGPQPAWEKIYSDNTPEHWELGGIRGLTAVADPEGPGRSLLFTHTDRVIRVDPARGHRATVELRIRPLLERAWSVAVPGSIIAAYSHMLPLTDPATGRTVHILGVQGRVQRGGRKAAYREGTFFGWYAGGTYLIREGPGRYRVEEVNGPWAPGRPKLVAPRTFVVSPFAAEAGRVVYIGGFDANFFPARDTAWVFRASVQTVLGRN